jgi:hypothetical protein
MKLTYICIILLCLGCRTVREQQEIQNQTASANMQWQLQEQHQGIRYLDSQGRHWSFWSDSLFYFHPDSGLSAYSGTMQYRDVYQRNWDWQVQHLTKDSVTESNERTSVYSWIKTDTRTKFRIGIILVLFVVGGGYWFYRQVK